MPSESGGIGACRALYIDLLKRALLNRIYSDREAGFDENKRATGMDWPNFAHTMIGQARLDNLQSCVETVLHEGIPGDLIETGIWRGGSCIFMRGMLKAYGETGRKVWVADSFEGLPPPNVEKYPRDEGVDFHKYPALAVGLEEVKANFERYGLLDDQVVFLKGWFKDTLPKAPIERLAVLRLDGDMYESTMDALFNLYPKLSPGGFAIIDDYALYSCANAVHDYRRWNNIADEIKTIDWCGAFWRKPIGAP